jgi:hypothetical protein
VIKEDRIYGSSRELLLRENKVTSQSARRLQSTQTPLLEWHSSSNTKQHLVLHPPILLALIIPQVLRAQLEQRAITTRTWRDMEGGAAGVMAQVGRGGALPAQQLLFK